MHRFSVAPMLDWTDRHCRFFHRLITGKAKFVADKRTNRILVVTRQENYRYVRDVITQLDAISGQAIDLLKPIAPSLVAQWHTQTQASLATLQAAVAKGVTASEFSSVIQSSNTAAYQKVSKQIGLIVHERCPSLSTTTTTTAGG